MSSVFRDPNSYIHNLSKKSLYCESNDLAIFFENFWLFSEEFFENFIARKIVQENWFFHAVKVLKNIIPIIFKAFLSFRISYLIPTFIQ